MISSSFGREIGVDAHGGSRLAVQDGVEDDGGGVAAEGNDAGGHLVQHSAEGEQVAAGIEFLALGLLRRHVGDRADGRAGAGQILQADAGGDLGLARGCQRIGCAAW